MLDVVKTLIADFHAGGIPKGGIRRDLIVPLDAPKVISVISVGR